MNTTRSITLAGLVLMTLTCHSAFGQMRPADHSLLNRNLGQAKVDPNLLHWNRREPIPFRPFPRVDPQTGRLIAPGAQITLHNGRRVDARTFYDRLDNLERQFNQLGYSLRGPEHQIMIGELRPQVNPKTQQREIYTAHLKPSPDLDRHYRGLQPALILDELRKRGAKIPEIRLKERKDRNKQSSLPGGHPAGIGTSSLITWLNNPQMVQQMVAALTKLLQSEPQHYQWGTNWTGWGVGDPNLFSVQVGANAMVEGGTDSEPGGKRSSTHMHVEGDVQGSVFGNSFEVARAVGDMTSTVDTSKSDSSGSLDFDFYVLGFQLVSEHHSNAAMALSNGVSEDVSPHVGTTIPVGPIPVTAEIGVNGSVGVNYTLLVAPLTASGETTPYLDTQGYVKAGIGGDFFGFGASVGVKGQLTFLQGDLDFIARASIGDIGPNILHLAACGQDQFHALSGELDLYAEIDYLFGSSEWDCKIAGWDGFDASGTIFDYDKQIQLW
ncbi:MAG TPA: hypothetical protein VFA07_05155 [Chthonomonadaceae bacterium]|nr:hypothetical protein [Chthonomonadaceae bacterium]